MPAARALRVAIVHDWLVTYAGAEKVLEQIIACNARLTTRATEHFTGEMTKFAQLMAKMALLRPPER